MRQDKERSTEFISINKRISVLIFRIKGKTFQRLQKVKLEFEKIFSFHMLSHHVTTRFAWKYHGRGNNNSRIRLKWFLKTDWGKWSRLKKHYSRESFTLVPFSLSVCHNIHLFIYQMKRRRKRKDEKKRKTSDSHCYTFFL